MSDLPRKEGVVRTILSKSIKVLENFSSIMILIMVLLTFADVIGRYLLAAPIFGASEMISALLALAIFSGLGVTNARDDHIVVELFDHRVRSWSPRLYDFIIHTFSIVAMALIAFVLFEHALESYQQDARTYVLEMPLYYITASVAFLALISVVSQIAGIGLKLFGDENRRTDRL